MRVHDPTFVSCLLPKGVQSRYRADRQPSRADVIRTARILEAADRFWQQVLGQPQDLCEDFDTHRGDVREELEVMAVRQHVTDPHSRRMIMLTRRHLEPAALAYIRAYRQRFGDNGSAT